LTLKAISEASSSISKSRWMLKSTLRTQSLRKLPLKSQWACS
jgi:hypothetical protein